MLNSKFNDLKLKYKKTINNSIKKYKYIIELNELEQLINIALWKTYLKFDSNKSSFSSYLFNMIRWEVLNFYRSNSKFITNKKMTRLKDKRNNDLQLVDLKDNLDKFEQQLFDLRFIEKRTFIEISKKLNISKSILFEYVKKIRNKIAIDLT